MLRNSFDIDLRRSLVFVASTTDLGKNLRRPTSRLQINAHRAFAKPLSTLLWVRAKKAASCVFSNLSHALKCATVFCLREQRANTIIAEFHQKRFVSASGYRIAEQQKHLKVCAELLLVSIASPSRIARIKHKANLSDTLLQEKANMRCTGPGVSKIFCQRATWASEQQLEGATSYVMWWFRVMLHSTKSKHFSYIYFSLWQNVFEAWWNDFAGRILETPALDNQ